MILGKRWRSWSILLLIASAIQGITPDANDLASFTLLELLSPGLADTNSSVSVLATGGCDLLRHELPPLDSGSVPVRDDDQESLPDEAGVLSLITVRIALRHRSDTPLRLGPAPVGWSDRRTSSDHLGLEVTLGNMARGNHLVRLLCRLTC